MKKALFTSIIILIILVFAIGVNKSYALASPVEITNSAIDDTNTDNGRNVVADSNDDLYIAYTKPYLNYWHIFFAKSTDSGANWTHSPVPLETTGNYHQAHISLAIDSSDELHGVWVGYDSANPSITKVKYASYAGADWSDWINIDNSGIYNQHYPTIAVDSANHLHVMWMEKPQSDPSNWHIKYANYNGSAWSTAEFIEPLAGYSQEYPQMALDSNNNVHAVWAGKDPSNSQYQIKYMKRTGNTWSGLDNIQTVSGFTQYKPSIAIDDNNNLHVAWMGTDAGNNGNANAQVKYSKYNGTSWSNWVNIWPLYTYGQGFPSISLSNSQNPWIAWYGENENISTDMLYSSYFNGYSWQQATARTSSGNNRYPLIQWSRFNNNRASSMDFSWQENSSGSTKLMFDNLSYNDSTAEAPAGSPQTPTISSVQPQTSTSIKWNFTDNSNNEQGFRAYDQNGNLLATNGSPNKNYVTETGLSPNTFYSGRHIRAYNQNGESLSSNPARSIYTKIESPTSLSFSNVGNSSITVTANGTLSNLTRGSSGLFIAEWLTTSTDSGWIKSNSWTINNLTPAQLYGFSAKSRNSWTVENSPIDISYKATLPNKPGKTRLNPIDSSSVKLRIDPNGNYVDDYTYFAVLLAEDWARGKKDPRYKYITRNGLLSDEADVATYAQWGGLKGITVKGLKPNMQYGIYATALNAEYVSSGWNTANRVYTRSRPPRVDTNLKPKKWSKKTNLTVENDLKFEDDIEYYRYTLKTGAKHDTWTGKEDKWSKDDLSIPIQRSGKYYLHLQSYNQIGREPSQNSNSFSSTNNSRTGPFYFDLDEPAEFNLTSPESDAYVSNATDFSWEESTDKHSGLKEYEVYLDDEKIGTSQSNSYHYEPESNLSEGWHKWQVKAKDKVGYVTASSERQFFVDATKPSVKILDPKNNSIINGKLQIKVKSEDDVFLDKIDLYVDNSWFGSIQNDKQSFEVETKALSEGRKELKAVAYDAAGNENSDKISIIVDNKAPETTLLLEPSKPDGLNGKYETAPLVFLKVNEESLTYYGLDNKPLSLYSYPFFIPRGKHVLKYQSKDLAGNEEKLKTKSVEIEENPFFLTVQNPKDTETVSGLTKIQAVLKGVKGKPSLKIKVDNKTVSKVSKNSINYVWDTSKEKNGTHNISIIGIDSSTKIEKVSYLKIKVQNNILNYLKKMAKSYVEKAASALPKTAAVIIIPFIFVFAGFLYLTGQHFIDWRSEKLN